MLNTVVLSEIHTGNINREVIYNPVVQAHRWYGLLNTDEMKAWNRACNEQRADFVHYLTLIAERTQDRSRQLIIREFSHVDYIATPRTNPTYQSTIHSALNSDCRLLRFALVRHPLKQWRSFQEYPESRDRTSLGSFLSSYRRFAEMSAQVGFIRYEDFCADPVPALKTLCQHLQIRFDSGFQDRWQDYVKLTGDKDHLTKSLIRERSRPAISLNLLEEASRSQDFQQGLDLLGYRAEPCS